MEGAGIFSDAFERVHETLHNALSDLTPEELIKEPHPPMGWLAWRATRTQDAQLSRLAGKEQAWIGDGWHARFNMPPLPQDYGPGLTHTRAQVAAFRAPNAQILLDYHNVVFRRTQAYLSKVTPQEARPRALRTTISAIPDGRSPPGERRYEQFARYGTDPLFEGSPPPGRMVSRREFLILNGRTFTSLLVTHHPLLSTFSPFPRIRFS